MSENYQENAEHLAREINSLDSFVNGFSHDYKGFWAKVKEIDQMFKDLRFNREDRNSLWSSKSAKCDEVSKRQTSEREKLKRDSRDKRDIVMERINSASGYIESGTRDGFDRARELLAEAMGYMKTGWNATNVQTSMMHAASGNEGRMTKEDHEACWQAYQNAQERLRNKRNQVWNDNYSYISGLANSALHTASYGDPYEARKEVKAGQAEMKTRDLNKDMRLEIRRIFENAFSVANQRVDEAKREKERKHQDWRRRQEEGLAKLREALRKCEDAKYRVEKNISDNKAKLYDAKGNFYDVVQGWISESESKLNDIERSISDLERKIRDAEDRLNN